MTDKRPPYPGYQVNTKRGKRKSHAPEPVYSLPHPHLLGSPSGVRDDLYTKKPRPSVRGDHPIIPKPSKDLPYGGGSIWHAIAEPPTVIKSKRKAK